MEWIKIEDDLPILNDGSEYDEYNVYCEHNKFIGGLVTTLSWTEHGWYDNNNTCWNGFVLCWQELPEKPKAI